MSATPPPPSLTPSDLTQTGATLTIANHIGDWYYKHTSPGDGTCSGAVSGDSATVTMTANTDYTLRRLRRRVLQQPARHGNRIQHGGVAGRAVFRDGYRQRD